MKSWGDAVSLGGLIAGLGLELRRHGLGHDRHGPAPCHPYRLGRAGRAPEQERTFDEAEQLDGGGVGAVRVGAVADEVGGEGGQPGIERRGTAARIGSWVSAISPAIVAIGQASAKRVDVVVEKCGDESLIGEAALFDHGATSSALPPGKQWYSDP